ncbi:glycosyltransferase [Enterobacter sp. BRE11]|nr:glycosyltransferase [Enterobacter sp. BRE11]
MSITALIVTYNRLDKLKMCIEATRKAQFDKIVIVDNASSDGTGLWLKSIESEQCRVVYSGVNSGGAGGFKIGLEYISQHIMGNWVALFDDDAYPDETLVSRFKAMSKDSYAAFSCRVIDKKNQLCRMNLPFRKMPQNFLQDMHYLWCSSFFQPAQDQQSECVTLSFVGAIVRQDVIKYSLPFLHDDLFIYFDDLYYSYHLNQAGNKMLYCPDLVFIHDVSSSNGIILPQWKVYYLVRNLLLSRQLFKFNKPFTMLGITLRLTKYFSIVIKQPHKRKYLSFFLRGLCDGLLGIKGKRF